MKPMFRRGGVCALLVAGFGACFSAVRRLGAEDKPFSAEHQPQLPVVVTTWANPGFVTATERAWSYLRRTGDRLGAVVEGCSTCEELQCDYTVGYGGSPDESGETTLEAILMDGPGHRMGAVGDLRRVKSASRVARYVMETTTHSIIVGESATKFAKAMGFVEENLTTVKSDEMFAIWRKNNCQPNYRKNVSPDPRSHCGPYRPSLTQFASETLTNERLSRNVTEQDHDTIGMVIVDRNGDISVGTSTNGATHKVPGRVGDSPIPGAGAYVDNDVGGAAGTGDGDVMMRFLPSYQAVESMRSGLSPGDASEVAIRRIIRFYPKFSGAVIAADKSGRYGAACHGLPQFSYSVFNDPNATKANIVTVRCVQK